MSKQTQIEHGKALSSTDGSRQLVTQMTANPSNAGKFTPGPWHRNIRAGGKYSTVFAGRNTHVAHVCQQPTGDETEANIDLVAAAPALLALLVDVGQWLETGLSRGEINRGTANRDGDLVTQIRAAIKSAKGQP